MMTDSHIHILPGIDDGSKNAGMSAAMAYKLKKSGIERIIATPHFYCHREKSVKDFLEKRQSAFEKMTAGDFSVKNVVLGAEVAVEHGLSEAEDIEKLAIQGTNHILLELPYTAYQRWYKEEIENIASQHGLKVIIAHIHRYIGFYSKNEMDKILDIDAVFQINNEAFGNFQEKKFVSRLIKDGYPVIFGSDAHSDEGERSPNWEILKKKAKSEVIEKSMSIADKMF